MGKKDNLYKHICDECGKIFYDKKEDMGHYTENNGLMLCKNCPIQNNLKLSKKLNKNEVNIMGKFEKYYNQIIEETGLSMEDIQKAVQEKRDELKGLIGEEGALFIVGKEYGVDVNITPPKDKEPESENWMEDLANVEIGTFEKDEQELKIAKGYNYTFKMIDSRKKPAEVKDVFKGKESKQIKFLFWVKLIGVAPSKKFYAELLKEEKPFIYEWVNELQKGKDYKWKISKTAAKQFAQFCLDEQINDDSMIRYTRFGESGDTTYEFKKLGKSE